MNLQWYSIRYSYMYLFVFSTHSFYFRLPQFRSCLFQILCLSSSVGYLCPAGYSNSPAHL